MTISLLKKVLSVDKKVKQDPVVPHNITMERVATIILGGGRGTRLDPLTRTRCKPAISFGGKYRLIDIPMSNAINSGCLKIFIITQFLSSSLHQHIYKTYRLGTFSSGFIEVLSAEQKPIMQNAWYQGPADAVRENRDYFVETPVDYFLILSGDQLYNMDFRPMLEFAKETDADLVVAALPVTVQDAKRMGVLKVNEDSFITEFCEKPQDLNELKELRTPSALFKRMGIAFDKTRQHLGSMGIYLFKRQALLDLLQNDLREDFGKHLIPTQVKSGKVAAYLFDGYWEDIGTIESFYKANIALTKSNPDFRCYNDRYPIFSSMLHLPPARIINGDVQSSLISEGSIVDAASIVNSILGPRSVVHKGTTIQDSYIMGNDFYTPPIKSENLPEKLLIGENCLIRNAIIEKHVSIGNGVQLINKNKLTHYDGSNVYIRDGIIIVTRGAVLPDGFIL